MLVLATAALAIPTLFAATTNTTLADERGLTHAMAVIMILLYALYLLASFQDPERGGDISHGTARWSVPLSLTVLAVTALATGVLSEILVAAIEPTIEETGISAVFIGLIIVPLVGNVAEHMAAVKIAAGGNLDFAMGIAFNTRAAGRARRDRGGDRRRLLLRQRADPRLQAARDRVPDRGHDARRPGGVEWRRKLDRGRAAARDLRDRVHRVLVPRGALERRASA